MKNAIIKTLTVTAAALLATGCVSQSAFDTRVAAVEAAAKAASQDAAAAKSAAEAASSSASSAANAASSAQSTANQALQAAQGAQACCDATNEKIDRAIKRGSGALGDAADYTSIMYEGYGPNGIAILIECLTDNKNRSAAEVRTAVTKNGGTMADPGSVSYQFARKGVIVVAKNEATTEDAILEAVLEVGIDDLEDRGEQFVPRLDHLFEEEARDLGKVAALGHHQLADAAGGAVAVGYVVGPPHGVAVLGPAAADRRLPPARVRGEVPEEYLPRRGHQWQRIDLRLPSRDP